MSLENTIVNISILTSELACVTHPCCHYAKRARMRHPVCKPLGGLGKMAWLLMAWVFLDWGAPAARADQSPPNCTVSGLGISLFTGLPDVHVGDTLYYSVLVFNTPFPACDA